MCIKAQKKSESHALGLFVSRAGVTYLTITFIETLFRLFCKLMT